VSRPQTPIDARAGLRRLVRVIVRRGGRVSSEAVLRAINAAILKAHRLGEPRVLELPPRQLAALRAEGDPKDFSAGPPDTYRGLRLTPVAEVTGRVLAWDRAREMDMVQRIDLPTGQARRR
jgi:hypothetical protein